jgi:hypothetical protein
MISTSPPWYVLTLHLHACRSIHLTNDAVQKKADHYDSFEDHNKLDMCQLQVALEQQGDFVDVEKEILPQMRSAASHVFSAALPAMQSSSVSYCFELFGLDFMIGEDKQVCSTVATRGLCDNAATLLLQSDRESW